MKYSLSLLKFGLVLFVLFCAEMAQSFQTTGMAGSVRNPLVIGAWWSTIDGSDWSDQQLAQEVHDLKWMNFTAIYCLEESVTDGSKDDHLNDTWTARMVNLAESEGLKIVWAVWDGNPIGWNNKDLNNQTFRTWFAGHLTIWQQFIAIHPSIIELVFDDFGVESQYLNMTEFTQFVRQYIPPPTMIEYDDRYDSLNPQYENGTVTEGYLYYYQDSNSWDGAWIDYIYQHYRGNYPYHTLGICLEAFDEGMGNWTPAKHLPLITKALGYNFTNYEYWAWRWYTPEKAGIAAHPEYWHGIKDNNQLILASPNVPEFTQTTILALLICLTLLTATIYRTQVRNRINQSISRQRSR